MTTLEKVKELLADKVEVDASTITEETKFADLGIDSLDIVEFLMTIEDELHVTIEPDKSLATVADLVKKIDELSQNG